MDPIVILAVIFIGMCILALLASCFLRDKTGNSSGLRHSLLIAIFALGFFMTIVWPMNATRLQNISTMKEYYGGREIYIASLANEINVRIWKPLRATKLDAGQIIFRDADAGIYSLSGIKFEPGLTEEGCLSNQYSNYIVCAKGTNLVIGPYNIANTLTHE